MATGKVVGMEVFSDESPDLGPVAHAISFRWQKRPADTDDRRVGPAHRLCADQLWNDEGLDLHLAVNLSPRQFQQESLGRTVNDIIRETDSTLRD